MPKINNVKYHAYMYNSSVYPKNKFIFTIVIPDFCY